MKHALGVLDLSGWCAEELHRGQRFQPGVIFVVAVEEEDRAAKFVEQLKKLHFFTKPPFTIFFVVPENAEVAENDEGVVLAGRQPVLQPTKRKTTWFILRLPGSVPTEKTFFNIAVDVTS